MQLSRRPRPVLYGALAFIMLALLAALFLTSDYFYNAAFALRPLCIARDLGWCDYVCTGGACTTPRTVFDNSFVLGATGFYLGSELPQARLRPFPLPRPDAAGSSYEH